jgi:hypothetical protein
VEPVNRGCCNTFPLRYQSHLRAVPGSQGPPIYNWSPLPDQCHKLKASFPSTLVSFSPLPESRFKFMELFLSKEPEELPVYLNENGEIFLEKRLQMTMVAIITHRHTYSDTYIQTHSATQPCTDTQTHTQTCTDTQTQTQTHKHTETHTDTHTQLPTLTSSPNRVQRTNPRSSFYCTSHGRLYKQI